MATVLQINVIGRETAPALRLDRRRRRLSAIAKRHADPRRPFVVSLHRPGTALRPTDETVRLRATWRHTLVGGDDVVVITYLPRGGGGNAAKQIGGAIAMVALAVAAPFAVGAFAGVAGLTGVLGTAGALTFAGQAVAAGIVIGGAYLIGQATRPKAQEASSVRPVYGVSGGGNLPRPGDRIPVGYGRFWTQPDLSQPDYFSYDGEDQVLRKRMTLGLGRYVVHRIMAGPATLWTAEDGLRPPFSTMPGGGGSGSDLASAVEIIAPGDLSALVPGSVYSSPAVGGSELARPDENPAWTGPFPASPVGQPTARIQLDYTLVAASRNNGQNSTNVGVLFEFAPCDDDNEPTGPFTLLDSRSGNIKTQRPRRYTRYINVAEGRYVVRGRNTQNTPADHVFNSWTWDGLRSHFDDTIARPHVTEIALRIRSGKNLGTTSFADIWVEATRIVPVWTGAAWAEQATRKSVYAYADVLRSAYGGNLADTQVDLATVIARASQLTDNDTFDGVIRGPVSVYEAATTVLGTMRAEPSRVGRMWSLTRDEPRVLRRHVFSRRQIARGSTIGQFPVARDDGAADVIVEYHPGADPRRRREIRRTFGAPSLTPRRVLLQGVASHEHAWELGTWLAACAYFRRERREITVDRRGRLVTRGDPALIDAWFMAEAKAAGVTARDGLTLTLDTEVPAEGAYALLRDRHNVEWGPVAIAEAPAPNVITLDAADVAAVEAQMEVTLANVLAHDDEEMTTVLVGQVVELQDPYLIESMLPQARDRIAIEAVYDHPDVWVALGEAPPPPLDLPSLGDISEPALPVIPWIRARPVQRTNALEMDWSVGRVRNAAVIVVDVSFDDGETWERVSEGLETSGSHPIPHQEEPIIVRAYAVDAHGNFSAEVTTTFQSLQPVIPIDALPPPVRDRVTSEFADAMGAIDLVMQRIANAAAEQDAANALEVFGLRAALNDAAANISVLATTVVNDQIAFASYQTTVSAQFGSLTASVVSNASALASIDGTVAALYTLEVNAGRVAGLRLGASPALSFFDVEADVFRVGYTGETGGSFVPAFQIATVDGTTKLALRGDMLADGDVHARSITVDDEIAIQPGGSIVVYGD